MDSARGLAHSKTLRAHVNDRKRACVLDCGGPPALFNGYAKKLIE
jgi:hypothetical protein